MTPSLEDQFPLGCYTQRQGGCGEIVAVDSVAGTVKLDTGTGPKTFTANADGSLTEVVATKTKKEKGASQ